MIKNAIQTHTHETDFYHPGPAIDNVKKTENEFIPLLLQIFIKELVQITSEAEFSFTDYFRCIEAKGSYAFAI